MSVIVHPFDPKLSAAIQECRIYKCRSRNPDGTCRETTVNISSLTTCSKVNTKTQRQQSKPRDWSPNSIGRTVDQ